MGRVEEGKAYLEGSLLDQVFGGHEIINNAGFGMPVDIIMGYRFADDQFSTCPEPPASTTLPLQSPQTIRQIHDHLNISSQCLFQLLVGLPTAADQDQCHLKNTIGPQPVYLEIRGRDCQYES